MSETKRFSYEDWCREAASRFGPDTNQWKFVCPVCGHVASVQQWRDAGADNGAAFSCIGRWIGANRKAFANGENGKSGPCDYAGGGLFRLNPVTVVDNEGNEHNVFDLAEIDKAEGGVDV